MKRMIMLFSFGAVLTALPLHTHASGDPERGQAKAQACMACHGKDGNPTDPQNPRLAGQYDAYLQQILHEYKDGRRNNAIMKGMVTTLSDQDIEDIAAYFSLMPSKLGTLKGHVQGD